MPSFSKNIIITFFSRFSAAIFTFLSTILISRTFGPIGKGIFTMVVFFPILALNLGHLGLGNANTYLISQDQSKTRDSFYNSFWYGLIIGAVFIIMLAWLYRLFPQDVLGRGDIGARYFLLSLFIIPFLLWENFYQGIFVGRQEFKFFNFVNLLSKIILFGGLIILIFALKSTMYFSVLYYLCLMVFPACVYSVYFLKQYGLPLQFNNSIFLSGLNFGIKSYLACFLAFLIFRFDLYFVNFFRGLHETGLYSLSVNFSDSILLIVSSIALVLFPKITKDQEQGMAITLQVARAVSFIIGAVIIVSFIVGGRLIPLVFGESFRDSLPAFYILLPAIYFWSITSVLLQYFASKNLPWLVILIWVPGFLLNIILNIILIPRFGFVAAALTSLLAYFLTFALYFFYLQTFQKISLRQLLIANPAELKSIKNNLAGKNENF